MLYAEPGARFNHVRARDRRLTDPQACRNPMAMVDPRRCLNPRVVVTRELPDPVMERMAALFETESNPADEKLNREQLAAAMNIGKANVLLLIDVQPRHKMAHYSHCQDVQHVVGRHRCQAVEQISESWPMKTRLGGSSRRPSRMRSKFPEPWWGRPIPNLIRA